MLRLEALWYDNERWRDEASRRGGDNSACCGGDTLRGSTDDRNIAP